SSSSMAARTGGQLLLRHLLLLVPLTYTVAQSFGDDDLGSPISPGEFTRALADPSLLEPPPENVTDIIEQSGEYEGDIMLTPQQQAAMAGRSATKNTLWDNGEIPYTISSTFTTSERQVIARAMAEYEARTCIRFIGRTTHTDYIHIMSGSGCSSYVGRIGGRQTVSLSRPGCVYFGIVIHEFMHASGFHHEQSRYDRDDYVPINWGNILSGVDFNFEKKSKEDTTDLGLVYDYNSIMHYGATAFSKNGQSTIISKKAGVTLGQRKGFSVLDVNGLNLLYKCKGSECIDKNPSCQEWADSGECQNYPDYMLSKCPKACNLCGGGCTDKNQNCKEWADSGECQKNPDYMQTSCQKACDMCGKTKFIKLSSRNIIDHGGFGSGGAGPENLLTVDGKWNPNPKPWFATFDFARIYKVKKLKLINYGDTIHDVTSFSIESSNNKKKWNLVDVIYKVATGTKKPQFFLISGEGRYWRLTIKQTASEFQPWLRFFGFYGEKKPISACKDTHKNCRSWANSGYCKNEDYKTYMKKNCPKACNVCF
ncbi:unnamed protein product, partial [Meganyctiphanes norvegica]